MANFGDFRGTFNTLIAYLKSIDRSLRCISCGGTAAITTAGTGDIPAGLKSLSVVKTSPNTDTVTITMSDATTYQLLELGEVFTVAASPGGVLPDFTISGPGTWKWHGVK